MATDQLFLLQFVNQKDDFILDSLSSKERYEFDMKRSIAMAKLSRESGDLETTKAMLGGGIGSALMPDGNALGLHFVMFVPTIMGQVGLFGRSTTAKLPN